MSLSNVTIYTGDVVRVPIENLVEIKRCDQEVKNDRASAKAHRVFGEALQRIDQTLLATEEYVEAGKLYDKQCRYDNAYRCYRDALLRRPGLIKPKVLFAYLCKKLGFQDKALEHFKSAVFILFKGNEFAAASCYLDEALILASQDPVILMMKARCIFNSSHPIDEKERVKNAVAVVLPLIDKLHGKMKAKVYYLIGSFYKQIDQLLAKQNFLNCIWYSLDVEDYPCAQLGLNELKELEKSNIVTIIDEFLQYIKSPYPQNYDPIVAIKICDDLLALHDVPFALQRKAKLHKGTDIQLTIAIINRFLNLLPKDHSIKKLTFLARFNGEKGHPNETDLLKNIITKVVDLRIPWEQFHREVYSELLRKKLYDVAYFFKYGVNDVNFIQIGESDHLLFFSIFNLDIRTFQRLLKKCNESLLAIRDSNGNTLVHVAACFGFHELVKALMMKAHATGELSALINSRNQDGTNPLGMLFLDTKLSHEKIVNVARLFIKEPCFRINSYLNNTEGMDFGSQNFLKKIGGLTCLHVALERGLESVLDLLKQRNHSLSISAHSDDFVNMTFPSLNPDHHMNSPDRFIPSNAPNKANLKQFLAARKAEIKQADLDDSSGDSDDEDAPAFQHKKVLTDLASIVIKAATPVSPPQFDRLNKNLGNEQISLEEKEELEKEQAKLAVVHFHGVPFMEGHYTNFQRRFVGRKIQEINATFTKSPDVKDDKLERLKAIHSRTSTATAGIQTLYDVMTASDEQLEKLEAIDEKLRSEMAYLWMDDETKFIGALKEYIYNFSKNPIQPFWQAFLGRVANIVRYRFPICSLSKAPDHAVKFAAGENVETQSLGEERMDPNYNNKGKPLHRLVGLLYVTFHSIADIHKLQNHCALADIAQLRCSKQMSTSQPRTDNQLEVSFFGGVSGKDVKVIIPIIYPNLSKRFKKGYHDVIWGLNENDFTYDSMDFETVKHAFTNFALNVVKAIAGKEGRTACFIDETNVPRLFPTNLKEKKKLSHAHLKISEGTVTKTGVKKAQLTKTTPEQLSQPTVSKQLSSSSSLEREIKSRARQEDMDDVKRDINFGDNK